MIDHVQEKDIPDPPEIREGENSLAYRNNQLIFFGRDRPAGKDSGYGSEPESGQIHIVVGRKNRDVSFDDDKSFIYTAMLTDVDKNLKLDSMEGMSSMVGPAIIAKSDNIRVMHRATGDVRITSEDGKNFIVLTPSRCEIRFGASWLKIEDGMITIEAGKIDLGKGAESDKVILGNKFMQIYNEHTHQSPVGPTSKPILGMMVESAHLSAKSFVE